MGQRLLLPAPEFIAVRALKLKIWFYLCCKRGTTLYAALCFNHLAYGMRTILVQQERGTDPGPWMCPASSVECWTIYSRGPKDMVHSASGTSWLLYTPLFSAGIPQILNFWLSI